MDNDTDLAACAATDLNACLQGQRDRARARLRAAELELDHLAEQIREGSIDYPVALVDQVQTGRCEVAAIDHVLADLRGERFSQAGPTALRMLPRSEAPGDRTAGPEAESPSPTERLLRLQQRWLSEERAITTVLTELEAELEAVQHDLAFHRLVGEPRADLEHRCRELQAECDGLAQELVQVRTALAGVRGELGRGRLWPGPGCERTSA